MASAVVKFVSGEEKEGEIILFNVTKPTFHLQVTRDEGRKEIQLIRTDSVKMILFLKRTENAGTYLRTETIDQSVYAGTTALRLRVSFKDGEVITGSTLKYDPSDKGFFLIPLNPADRSERIYINAKTVKSVHHERLFGHILVEQKKITSEQLEKSLRYQTEQREKKIGAILREKAIISDKQLQESLQKQKEKNQLLGEILLEAGYITDEQLGYALSVQRANRKKKLGQILVELQYIAPNDICIALATQFHCPWMDLSQVKIPLEIALSLPEVVVRSLDVIPVEKKNNGRVLVVATSQPQDPSVGLEVSKHTPLNVELVVAYEGDIEAAIDLYFKKADR